MPFPSQQMFLRGLQEAAADEGMPGLSVPSPSRGTVNILHLFLETAVGVMAPAIQKALEEGSWTVVPAKVGATSSTAPILTSATLQAEAQRLVPRCGPYAQARAAELGWKGEYATVFPLALTKGLLRGILLNLSWSIEDAGAADWSGVNDTYLTLVPIFTSSEESLILQLEAAWSRDEDTRSPQPGSQRTLATLIVSSWLQLLQWFRPVCRVANGGGSPLVEGDTFGPSGNVVML